MTLPPAARYYVPYIRPFPILQFEPCEGFWYRDWFGKREISRAEAERLAR